MKIKYYISALLCMMILFTSFPVSAAEVSGNDANNGIMLLSANDGIATTGTYYPNSILNDTIQKSAKLSYYTDIINLDFKLCDIYFNGDSDFYSRCNLLDLYFPCTVSIYDTDSIEVPPSILNYKMYVNINGKKYYFINQWESIVPDDYIFSAVGHIGIELQLNNKDNEFYQFFYISMNGDATKNTIHTDRYDYDLSGQFSATSLTKSPVPIDITVSWTNVEWDIRRENNTVSGIISNIYNHIVGWSSQLSNQLIAIESNILNKIQSVYENITNQFATLFSKMDEEREEIINGYDDSQASESNNELSGSLNTYQDTENAVTDEAFSGIGEYTVTEHGAQSFATQFLTVFPLVASMMQSFYQSASSFNIVISVIFTTIIASMVIGLFRFYRR